MDQHRYHRWITTSHRFGSIERFLPPVVQSLGRLDCQLIAQDEDFLRLTDEQRGSIEVTFQLNDRMTQSYLWVLGGYELIRSATQRLRGLPLEAEFKSVKNQFNRLRIPLAKFEAARGHPEDSPIAFPALNEHYGAAWQLGRNEFITRRELSDSLLALAERLDPPSY